MRDKDTIVAETEARTREGKIVPVRASCGYLVDAKGNITGGFEVISDNSAFIDMVNAMDEVEKGDLTIQIDEKHLNRDDAVGRMAFAIAGTIKKLADILKEVAINTYHHESRGNIIHYLPNLRGTYGIFLIGKDTST